MIQYRDAVPADAAELAALFAHTFTETFGHLYAPADLATFLADQGPDRWAAQLADRDYAVRVGVVDGRIVGYAKLGPPSLPVEPQGPSVELRQLYVLSDQHGSGAGQALIDWTIATARSRGAGELFLSVYIDNHRARRFYLRQGFQPVGLYTFMVGDHADTDELMRLAL